MVLKKQSDLLIFLKKQYNFIFVLFSIIILIFIDLFSKFFFMSKIFCENCFVFIRGVNNFGSSFGIFSSFSYYPFLIGILSVFVVAGLIVKRKYFMKDNILKWSYIMLISGILGNSYDRFFYGYVRDFIGIKSFFIFNIADVFIFLGVMLYLVYEYCEIKKVDSDKKIDVK